MRLRRLFPGICGSSEGGGPNSYMSGAMFSELIWIVTLFFKKLTLPWRKVWMSGKVPVAKRYDPVLSSRVNRFIMGGDNDGRAIYFV